jgi:hypothetical protein
MKNVLPSFPCPVGEFRRPKLLGEVSGIQLTELGSQTGPVLNVNFTKDPFLGLAEGGVGFASVMGSKGGSLLELRADGRRKEFRIRLYDIKHEKATRVLLMAGSVPFCVFMCAYV